MIPRLDCQLCVECRADGVKCMLGVFRVPITTTVIKHTKAANWRASLGHLFTSEMEINFFAHQPLWQVDLKIDQPLIFFTSHFLYAIYIFYICVHFKGPLCNFGHSLAVFLVLARTFLYTAPPTAS